MKRDFVRYGLLVFLALSLLVVAGCGGGKYGQFQSEEYQKAWKQVNDLVVKSKGKPDIKGIGEKTAAKAAAFEFARLADDPDKKVAVETKSEDEKKLIIKGWKKVCKKVILGSDAYFELMKDKLEMAAQLINDGGVLEDDGFKLASHYLFYSLHQYNESLDFLLKTGLSQEDAVKAIFEPLMVGGSAYYVFKGDEKKAIAFFQRVGRSKEESMDIVGRSASYSLLRDIDYRNSPAEEIEKKVKEIESKLLGFGIDEKRTAKLMGDSLMRVDQYALAVPYLEKAGEEAMLKEAREKLEEEQQ